MARTDGNADRCNPCLAFALNLVLIAAVQPIQRSAMHQLTATEIRAALSAGQTSARAVAEATIARINALNPKLNAIVQRMDDEALAAADAVDLAIRTGAQLGPLAGVPVTIKVISDQIGHATTNGTRAGAKVTALQDNPVVANLRRAGAILIGRSNTPAFSLRWFTRNGVHGATLNPINPKLTPGGSSGGAAAAVASGMGPIAHGTDIAGSIRYPAYACGIHGLRPSLGRVPAMNPSNPDRMIGGQLMAVSGPLARSIPDLRLALQAMASADARDPWYQPMPIQGAARPRRVALCLSPEGMQTDPALQNALRNAALKLQAASWQVDEVALPPLRAAMALQLQLWTADMRRFSGAAIYAEDDPDAVFVYENLCRHAPAPDLHGFMDIFPARARLVRQWRMFLQDYPLVMLPPSGDLPFEDHLDVRSEADFDRVIEAQLPQIAPPLMGLPGLCVTTGQIAGPLGGTPVGVQLLADHYREDLLLEAGEVIAETIAVVG
jgi:amidase